MRTGRHRYLAAAAELANTLLVAMTIVGFFTALFVGESVRGAVCFRYFTIDSNILSAAASAVTAVFLLKGLRRGTPLPHFVLVLKYVGTVAVCLTFLTVCLFLGPTQGYDRMFSGSGLWLHLICPLLSAASLLLLERGGTLARSEVLLGMIPMAVYGAVYTAMVLIAKVWPDFYGFTRGGLWYVSWLLMLAGTLAICTILALLYKYPRGDGGTAPSSADAHTEAAEEKQSGGSL